VFGYGTNRKYSGIKKKDVLERIERLEAALSIAHEYLETGAHADWHGFRALFSPKVRGGKVVPPHKSWVENVYIPARERALRKAEDLLEKLE